jgi:hypothetical protein
MAEREYSDETVKKTIVIPRDLDTLFKSRIQHLQQHGRGQLRGVDAIAEAFGDWIDKIDAAAAERGEKVKEPKRGEDIKLRVGPPVGRYRMVAVDNNES